MLRPILVPVLACLVISAVVVPVASLAAVDGELDAFNSIVEISKSGTMRLVELSREGA